MKELYVAPNADSFQETLDVEVPISMSRTETLRYINQQIENLMEKHTRNMAVPKAGRERIKLFLIRATTTGNLVRYQYGVEHRKSK